MYDIAAYLMLFSINSHYTRYLSQSSYHAHINNAILIPCYNEIVLFTHQFRDNIWSLMLYLYLKATLTDSKYICKPRILIIDNLRKHPKLESTAVKKRQAIALAFTVTVRGKITHNY